MGTEPNSSRSRHLDWGPEIGGLNWHSFVFRFNIIKMHVSLQKICTEMEQQKQRLEKLRAAPVAAPPEDSNESDSRLAFNYPSAFFLSSTMIFLSCAGWSPA